MLFEIVMCKQTDKQECFYGFEEVISMTGMKKDALEKVFESAKCKGLAYHSKDGMKIHSSVIERLEKVISVLQKK